MFWFVDPVDERETLHKAVLSRDKRAHTFATVLYRVGTVLLKPCVFVWISRVPKYVWITYKMCTAVKNAF